MNEKVETTFRPRQKCVRPQRYTALHLMTDSPRPNWTATYLTVIAVQILVLLALWWLGRHFQV